MTATSSPDPRHSSVSDRFLFFAKFLQQGRHIAALSPSSRWLARTVVAGIDWAAAKCVVELGAGTGPITRELLAAAKGSDCRILVIERDVDFCVRLREHFPGADIVQGDALELPKLLADRNVTHVDHVISGLPLSALPESLRNQLVRVVGGCLAPEGTFRQLTHIPWVWGHLYRTFFNEVRFRLVTLNFPPGGVYICRGLKQQTEAIGSVEKVDS